MPSMTTGTPAELTQNMLQLYDQKWDEERLVPRRTVICSENAKHQGS